VQNVNRNHGHYRLLQQSENRKFLQHPANFIISQKLAQGSAMCSFPSAAEATGVPHCRMEELSKK
jgi:hypothetical protein